MGLPVVGLIVGTVVFFATAFVDYDVEFSLSGDLHFGLGGVVSLFALLRRPDSFTSDSWRLLGLGLMGTGSLHVAATMSNWGWHAVLPAAYFGVAGIGAVMCVISAARSSLIFGRSKCAIGLVVFGLGLGALWNLDLMTGFGLGVGGFGSAAGAVGLAFIGVGVVRVWLHSNQVGYMR